MLFRSATQDPSQDRFSGSTHTLPVDKSVEKRASVEAAAALVKEWLLVQKVNREPFASEVSFAGKILQGYETTEEAYGAVRQGMLLLKQRGLLDKALTFNSLKLVFGGES